MLTLKRFWMSADKPTIGAFMQGNDVICGSFELPWKENQHDISCIPTGIYQCKWDGSIGQYRLSGVPNRGGIKIHKGNWATQILGCILPGDGIGFSYPMRTFDSGLALGRIRTVGGDKFELKIEL
jgi:hypothetical protein